MASQADRPGSLRSLLGQAAAAPAAGVGSAAPRVEIDKLKPNPRQYRQRVDPDKIEELAASIALLGQVEAITYRRTADGALQIIAGERRWRAAQLLRDRATTEQDRARYSTILANERVVTSEDEMLDLAIVENLQRADPDEVDTAAALAEVQKTRDLAVPELAKHFSIKADRAKRLLRLHACPPFIKDAMGKGLMVPLLGEDGRPLVTEGGRPRQEHRTLDLMAALEFGSLHGVLERMKPGSTDKRVEALVRQALEQGWAFRVIQDRCRKEKERAMQAPRPIPASGEGDEGEGSAAAPREEREPPPPFRDDERQLVIYRTRLDGATADQRAALRTAVETLLRALP